jgi:hypothetical protein
VHEHKEHAYYRPSLARILLATWFLTRPSPSVLQVIAHSRLSIGTLYALAAFVHIACRTWHARKTSFVERAAATCKFSQIYDLAIHHSVRVAFSAS